MKPLISPAALVAGNRLTLLKNGGEFFPALIEKIDQAQSDVRLETYIFSHDPSGIAVADALMRAARRGVAVRVLVDGFGSRTMPSDWQREMQAAGVMLIFFRPERGIFRLRRNRIRRLHRKIVLIDGRVGFIGGINLIDDFVDQASTTTPPSPRLDYAVQLEGPVLARVYPPVLHLWRRVKLFALKKRGDDFRGPPVSLDAVGTSAVAFLVRDNVRHRRDIERAYLQAIRGAQSEVLIASPYFLPGRRLRIALKQATKRGVAVTLLLQGAADHALLQMATRSLYAELLEAGIRIYEYQPAMLHGKVAVVDGLWSTVGSSNLDPFSLLLNREANVFSMDADFAATLRASVNEEIDRHAAHCHRDDWRHRSLWERAKSRAALLFARWVLSAVGARHD